MAEKQNRLTVAVIGGKGMQMYEQMTSHTRGLPKNLHVPIAT
jgi:hypothetical protein